MSTNRLFLRECSFIVTIEPHMASPFCDDSKILGATRYCDTNMRRSGLTFMEVVMITVILAVVAIPFLNSFRSLSRNAHRSARHTRALYLAQSILEQIRHRVTVDGELDPANLEEQGAKVVGADASQYFLRFENLKGLGLAPFGEESHPVFYQQLKLYECEIQVTQGSDVSPNPIDTDEDGEPEDDILEVGVTLKWMNPMGGPREATLWTLITSLDEAASP